jgi:uncharacterized protein (TIGR00255 family)
MTIRSMTGYGAAEGAVGNDRVTVDVRSVNHRFFNPSLKLPSALNRWERDVRDVIRRVVSRGHVTLTVRFGEQTRAGARIDPERFRAYLEELRLLAARHDIATPIDVGTVLRLPDVVTSDETTAESMDDPAPFLAIVERAVEAMDEMRRVEGESLGRSIAERVGLMEAAIGAIAVRAPARLIEQRDRLRRAVQELTEGITVDEQRVAQEIAFLADRLDVSEEVTRFRAHVAAFRATLSQPPADGVGKRLGFLIQEMLREANTSGSKANDGEMLAHVLVIKEELERVREQVENLE